MAKRKSRGSHEYDFSYGFFPASHPIRVEGGIQSRNQRGAFAANWWAKRWLAVLETYGIDSRLQRGRSYARSGQVLNIAVQPGQVTARVQGSRPKPYTVEIQVATLADVKWEHVLDAISQQAIFAAQLLDGEMPQEIETAFTVAKASLFPERKRDILTNCSCPDYSNPCKHIAAVYYLLGEQFDQDPFLIFTLRGRTREQIIEALRKRRATAISDLATDEADSEAVPFVSSLNEQVADFWGNDLLDWRSPSFASTDVNGVVMRRLGPPPGNLKQPLETLYRAMTAYVQVRIINDDETP